MFVLTLREFDMYPAHEEWNRLNLRKGVKTFRGNRVYQLANGGGGRHPANRYLVVFEYVEVE
jgi:hypothetical protein